MLSLKPKLPICALFVAIAATIIPQSLEASTWEIHTFGGGELIVNMLNMVKLIIYGNSSQGLGEFFTAFTRIAIAIGAVSAVVLVIYKQNPIFYFKNFLLPVFLILNVMLMHRTDVIVIDDAIMSSPNTTLTSTTKVDKVPFIYGTFISMLSELSHLLTKYLEWTTHQVNDRIYNWTGRIYAGEFALRLQTEYLIDKNLENNFREYCRTCVWNDLERGLYSRSDLMHAPNLLAFLKERTSNLNTMVYLDVVPKNGQDQATAPTRQFITCREAINKMEEQFSPKGLLKGPSALIQKWMPKSPGNISTAKNILENTLSVEETDLNYLLGRSKNNNLNFLRAQSSIIKMLKEEIPGTQNSFAARRAEAQNRESMKTLGAIAASNIVTMKNIFEALLYISFPLVCIFSLIPMMQKLMISWFKACIWIASLAPFYVIINAILSLIWNVKKKMMFGTSSDLTLYTYDGLLDMYDSMEAVAALAIGSIFTISFILMRSGFSGLASALPSVFSSAQSAAQTAASEKVTGNYNFSNVSLGNTHAYNYEAFKQDFTGRLNQNATTLGSGSQSMTYDSENEKLYLQQGGSRLIDSIAKTETFNQSVQTQLMNSETAVKEEGINFSNSVSETANNAVGMMQAYTSSSQYGNSSNLQEQTASQQAFQKIDSLAKEYSSAHNVSYEDSIRSQMTAGLGFSLFKTGIHGNMTSADGVSRTDVEGSSERTSQGESLTDLFQQVKNYSSSEMAQVLEGSDLRKHEDFSNAWNKTESAATHLRAAHSQQESLSQLQSKLESNSVTVQNDLNQSFVDYLTDKSQGDSGLVQSVVNLPSTHPIKQQYIDDFVSSYKAAEFESTPVLDTYQQYQQEVDNRTSPLLNREFKDPSEVIQAEIVQGKTVIESKMNRVQQDAVSSQNLERYEQNLQQHIQKNADSVEQHLEKDILKEASSHLRPAKSFKKALDLVSKFNSEIDEPNLNAVNAMSSLIKESEEKEKSNLIANNFKSSQQEPIHHYKEEDLP